MDRRVLDYLERRMSRDNRDYRRRRDNDDRYYGDERDYRDERDERDERDYGDYRDERDGRRGVKGTGRGRRRNRDRADYRDEADYEMHASFELTKADMHEWKRKMHNADGTKGPHYDMQQIVQIADKLGIEFDEYDEKEFCMAVNMMYSDYCKVIKKVASADKELMFCAELAKAFLEDEDGPAPSEKLALYYHCIVCGGDV